MGADVNRQDKREIADRMERKEESEENSLDISSISKSYKPLKSAKMKQISDQQFNELFTNFSINIDFMIKQ